MPQGSRAGAGAGGGPGFPPARHSPSRQRLPAGDGTRQSHRQCLRGDPSPRRPLPAGAGSAERSWPGSHPGGGRRGGGIDPALADRLFERGVSSKAEPDHGIGLALVRKTLDALQGQITIEATTQGSCVVCYIPKEV
ncbi:ATP-binding protein [Aeromonas hydrophila]